MKPSPSRRAILRALAGVPSGQTAAPAAGPATRPRRRVPVEDLVNTFEFEDVARTALETSMFSLIAGGDRTPFERMTFRPRMFVPSAPLDLTTTLLGERMFAPFVVGPVSEQRRFHPDGELATVRGAGAAKAVTVISSRSSEPIEKIVAAASAPVWFQVFSDGDGSAARDQAQKAIAAGCKALWITIGAPAAYVPGARLTATRPNWRALETISRDLAVPVALKGAVSPEDAAEAQKRGFKALVLSAGASAPAAVDALPRIADTVGSGLPLYIDGSVRRGTDVLKALSQGAAGAVVSRPVMWGLASHGADGVRTVLELLQSELARNMVTVGRPTLARIDRTLVTIHKPAGTASSGA